MAEPTWHDLCPASELPPGTKRCAQLTPGSIPGSSTPTTKPGASRSDAPGSSPPTSAEASDKTATPVVAINAAGTLFCLVNVCPHAGLPLGDGDVRGRTLTCPYHGYTYRLSDGADIDDPDFGEPATTLPIRVQGGIVQVQLP